MSDDSILSDEDKGPSAPYSLYFAEGEVLYKQGNYKKAVEYFSISLVLEPKEKHSLVARSKCYLQIGNVQLALEDAETALSEDPDYVKALYQKAEALYFMGDFEYALVFYHRAQKLHGTGEQYRLGVQKAQEAIKNAIGDSRLIKLEKKGDMSHFSKQAENLKGQRVTRVIQAQLASTAPIKPAPTKAQSENTIKQLLGELYADKKYLEKILDNSSLIIQNVPEGKDIFKHAEDALTFLESRQEFWRQQNPIYARKKSQNIKRGALSIKRFSTQPIFDAIERIQEALSERRYKDCISIAKSILFSVKKRFDIKERTELLCDIYNAMGNAYIATQNFPKAVDAYKNSLEVAKLHNNQEWKSLALNNMGRAYALGGLYAKAIETFQEKIPHCESCLELAWLYHEIGRCYFELNNFKQAIEFALKSLNEAEKADDLGWKLHANVLIAQTKAHMGDKIASMDKFHLALELTRQLGDIQMEAAIHRALFESHYASEKTESMYETMVQTVNDA